MKRIELISSKEYWVETLEAMQQLGHNDYEIATLIADKVVEAIDCKRSCTELRIKEKLTFSKWLEVNKYEYIYENNYKQEDSSLLTHVDLLSKDYIKYFNL